MKQQEFSAEWVQLATRIPKPLHLRVRVDALDQGVTMATWVEGALEEHLARCQGKKRAGKRSKAAEGAPKDAA